MIRMVVLLAPVVVSLFWAVALMRDNKRHHVSRRYLSGFMFVPALLFFCHFLYFANFPDWFVYFDLPLHFFGLLVFPFYHIYFRLLTVDDQISFKKHLWFNILPVIVAIVYGFAVFNSTMPEYKAWLFNKIVSPASPSVQFLQIMRTITKLTFLIQGIYYTTANHWLINQYSERATQFYSDIRDAKTNYAKLLNVSILASGIVALVLVTIGRAFLMSADLLIFIGWTVLTATVYLMGSLGARQKVINPDVVQTNSATMVQLYQPTGKEQADFMDKIMFEFNENKIFLNKQLNINDLAKSVGSNRTYLSSAINSQFNQNFCAFVNGFRLKELSRAIIENPDFTIEEYVTRCGFGSVNSMKRTVTAMTQMNFREFKTSLLLKQQA